MHSTVSRFSRECSRTFGGVEAFPVGLKSNYRGIDPAYRTSTGSDDLPGYAGLGSYENGNLMILYALGNLLGNF